MPLLYGASRFGGSPWSFSPRPQPGTWLSRARDIGAREMGARPSMTGMEFGTWRSGANLSRDIASARTLPGIQSERDQLLSNLMRVNALSRARRMYGGGYGGAYAREPYQY